MPQAPGELPALPGSGRQQKQFSFLLFNQFKTNDSVELERLMLILYYLSCCVCARKLYSNNLITEKR